MGSGVRRGDAVSSPSLAPLPRLSSLPFLLCTKTQYTKREAETVRNRRLQGKNRPQVLRIYQCNRCNRWHLTHQEKDGSE